MKPMPKIQQFGIPFRNFSTTLTKIRGLEIRGNEYAFLQLKSTSFVHTGDNVVRVVDFFDGCGSLALGVREAAFARGRGFRSVFV